MKRSRLVFAIAIVLSVLGVAVYADTAMAPAGPAGWLRADMEGASSDMVNADAQKLIGLTVDQLMNEMGPTALKSTDSSGNTEYYYEVHLAAAPGGSTYENLYVDVDSSGKVAKVSING